MKSVLFIFLILSPFFGVSQTDNKINYKATSIEMVIMKDGKTLSTKPYGRNVNIRYDKFFKSYYIAFETESGTGYFELSYINDMNDEQGTIEMSENNNLMYVLDKLKNEGMLMMMLGEQVDTKAGKARGYYFISGATLD